MGYELLWLCLRSNVCHFSYFYVTHWLQLRRNCSSTVRPSRDFHATVRFPCIRTESHASRVAVVQLLQSALGIFQRQNIV